MSLKRVNFGRVARVQRDERKGTKGIVASKPEGRRWGRISLDDRRLCAVWEGLSDPGKSRHQDTREENVENDAFRIRGPNFLPASTYPYHA